jgi:hypothetical protein
VLEDYVAPGFRYPPLGGIRPRHPVTTPVLDTPLLTGLIDHPSSLVRRCEVPAYSRISLLFFFHNFCTDILLSNLCRILPRALAEVGGLILSAPGWSARQEYREFLTELGFGPFLSIRYVHVWHPLVRCWVERFFHHMGTFHLSTCEMGVLPVDWSAILGIRFGGRAPPSEPISGLEALEILGIDDPAAIEGKKLPSLKGQVSEGPLEEGDGRASYGVAISSVGCLLHLQLLPWQRQVHCTHTHRSACFGMSTL